MHLHFLCIVDLLRIFKSREFRMKNSQVIVIVYSRAPETTVRDDCQIRLYCRDVTKFMTYCHTSWILWRFSNIIITYCLNIPIMLYNFFSSRGMKSAGSVCSILDAMPSTLSSVTDKDICFISDLLVIWTLVLSVDIKGHGYTYTPKWGKCFINQLTTLSGYNYIAYGNNHIRPRLSGYP